jgi:hypothetical protein
MPPIRIPNKVLNNIIEKDIPICFLSKYTLNYNYSGIMKEGAGISLFSIASLHTEKPQEISVSFVGGFFP